MIVSFSPSKAAGTVQAPPGKSASHRLLLAAGLSRKETVVRNVAFSADIEATLACLAAMGAFVHRSGDTVYLKGVSPFAREEAVFPCGESGSTLRFFIPAALLSPEPAVFTGADRLFARPLQVYEEICRRQGIDFRPEKSRLFLRGSLHPDTFSIPGDISSQFVTGLLYALPFLDGDSVLSLIPPVESAPYIAMTLDTLKAFGVQILKKDAYTYLVPGGQQPEGGQFTVEGDASNAAFLSALNLVGGRVQVQGVPENTLQGDIAYRRFFAQIRQGGAQIDLHDTPDLAPVLFAVSCLYEGAVFTGTRRLRMKESDRAAAMEEELLKFGASVSAGEDTFIVRKSVLHPPETMLDGHNDHRIVMALSVLCSALGGEIRGAEAVHKSYPSFFEDLQKLGVRWTRREE